MNIKDKKKITLPLSQASQRTGKLLKLEALENHITIEKKKKVP